MELMSFVWFQFFDMESLWIAQVAWKFMISLPHLPLALVNEKIKNCVKN